jgi:hypothetical protein
MTDQTTNPLEMSDDDFAKLNGPTEEVAEAASEAVTDPNPNPTVEADAAAEAETATAAEASAEAAGGEVEEEAKAEVETPAAEAEPDPAKADEAKADPAKAGEAAAEGDKTKEKETSAESETVQEEVDFKAAYERIMSFKANGKNVVLKNIDEAVTLMQMGANYTRRMQELQPHRKIVTMLANNDLLDEGKLSFLIDLDRKNPEAIKKLVKDAGIDPMDIDTDAETAYLPGSHAVSDEEVSFRERMGELSSTPEGKETISTLHQWDDASKQALWKDPTIMSVIHEQKQSGVYDLIADEVDRRRTLGQIPVNTPFLQAYQQVGDDLVAQAKGQGGGQSDPDPAGEKSPQVVAHRAATPKPTVTNDDKVKAASPTKAGSKKAEAVVNPLAMSDDAFLKSMEGRI